MPTLYEITEDMRAIDDLLMEAEGDGSDPAVLDAIEKWIAELDINLQDKVDGYASYISELLARAEARKAESDRLAALAKTGRNTATRLKDRLMWAMQERGLKKVETPRFVVSVRENGGKLPLDVQVPGSELPPRFQQVTIDPDNDAIRNALDAGEEIDGCTLMERGQHLSVR